MLTVLVRSMHSRKRLSLQRGLTGPASHPSPLVGGTLRVLGIESSCDDSCASIVTSDRQILSNVRLGQNHVHKAFNGIHPYHAIHAHQINLPIAIGRALHQAGLTITQLDAIAYTRGPGIAGCLAVGATAAKSLAAATGLPLVAVHHMQAHALTPFLTQPDNELQFPFLSLLVSGGHTMLVLVSSSSEFKILANTADKPLGLAIDKISRALEVPWPEGSTSSPGSALEKFVAGFPEEEEEEGMELPLALRTGPSVFSFCGLQTAAIRRLEALEAPASVAHRRAIGKAFFLAAFGQIERKLRYWLHHLEAVHQLDISGVVISGGVGSNQILRARVESLLRSVHPGLKLHTPPVAFCTDNAAMVAWTGIEKFRRGKLSAMDVPVAAKWSIEHAEDERPDTISSC